MIETEREDQEHLDSFVKRFRRQVTKHKVIQEVRARAHFLSKAVKKRLKKRRTKHSRPGGYGMSPRNHNNNNR